MNTFQRTSLLALLLMFILCSTAWTILNSNLTQQKESRSALPKAKENLINRIWYQR